MALPLSGQGFVVESLNQTKTGRPGEHGDVLPLFVPLEDFLRCRRQLLIDPTVLLDAPHATLCLCHIWHVNGDHFLRHNVRDDAHERARKRACEVSLSIARLAAPFGIASSVHGYADKDECDDNH